MFILTSAKLLLGGFRHAAITARKLLINMLHVYVDTVPLARMLSFITSRLTTLLSNCVKIT